MFTKKCTNYLVVSLLTAPLLFAQNDDLSRGAYTEVFIQRAIGQFDGNRDGNYDQKELGDEWKKYASLDQNQDGILSPEEVQKIEINYLSSKGEQKLNVLYKKTAEEDLYLDIYYPTNRRSGEKLPVMMYTHGGGWAVGSKQGVANHSFKTVSVALLEKGFCVVAVNYRLWHKDGSTSMRDCVIDTKDALRYLSKNNEELNVDTNRFYTFGDSAGGQIAQMLLLTSPESLVGDTSLSI